MATRARIWGDFKRWCAVRKLKALPAHPWTIAAYLRYLERRKGAEGVRATLDVIAREHLLKSARVPVRHPTVQSTVALIERRAETQGLRSSLFDETAMRDSASPSPPKKQPDESARRSPRRRVLASEPRLKRHRPGG